MLHERTYKSGSKRRRNTALLAAAFLSAAGLVAVTPAEAAPPETAGLFELDANLGTESAVDGDDWNDIFAEYTADPAVDASSAFASTGILPDVSPASIFTQGGSKDYLDITEWRHKDGNVPDKDEITNAYAAAYAGTEGDTDAYIYFGMDRFATEGSANVGFWFLQDDEFGMGEGDTFSGRHQVGDVLVLSEFDEGGENPTVKVFKWVGSGGDEGGGALETVFGGPDGQVADCGLPETGRNACAAVNGESPVLDENIPWEYAGKKDKGKAQLDIPIAAFFEGGINLTALFAGTGTPCFSSFVAETRSSFEVSAVLKDLVAGEFDLCGADISITPDGVNDVGDTHTFIVHVTKSVAGTTSDVVGVKPTVTIKDAAGNSVTEGVDTTKCDGPADGTDGEGECEVTLTSDVPGTFTASASATVAIGGSNIAVSTGNAPGQNPDAVKEFIDARITINPDDTNGIGEPHTFVVSVEEKRGGDWVAATTGHVDYTLTDAGGAVSSVDSATTCHAQGAHTATDTADNLSDTTVGTVPAGSCTITFSSATAGTVTGHATVTLQYDGPDENTTTGDAGDLTITRSTDGVADDPVVDSTNSADAVKTYVDGSLTWLKHDGEGNLLGGATFQVCQTHTYDSSDGSFDPIDTGAGTPGDQPACRTVADDVPEDSDTETATDTDLDPGEFELDELALGTYTIKETVAPSGYQIDPDTETVSITIDDGATSADESAGQPRNTDGTPKPFVNPALFKLIVLTCNQVTGELVDSTVTLDDGDPTTTDDTKETLTVDTADGLCDTGGAAYGNLPPGTYAPSVELPDRGPLFPAATP